MAYYAECLDDLIRKALYDKSYDWIESEDKAFALLDAAMRADSVGLLRTNDDDLEKLIEFAYTFSDKAQNIPKLKNIRHKQIHGYVYLLQSPSKYYKIGRTKNPTNRIKTFSVKLPFEIKYIALIETGDMVSLERNLHDRFADKRINGEWFQLTRKDVAYIKGLANASSIQL